MRRYPRTGMAGLILSVLLTIGAIFCALVLARPTDDDPAPHTGMAALLASRTIGSVDDLMTRYECDQLTFLRIDPPGSTLPVLQEAGVCPFTKKAIPRNLLRALTPVEKDGIGTYSILVRQDPATHERSIVDVPTGLTVARCAAPPDYDQDWILKAIFPAATRASWTDETRKVLRTIYAPSRVTIAYTLLKEDAIAAYATLYAPTPPDAGLPVMQMMGMGSSGLGFTGIDVVEVGGTNTAPSIQFTLSYPSGVSNIDVFACTDLMGQNWWLLLSTNLSSATNVFTFTDPTATNIPSTNGPNICRFYDAWNADTDSDSDSLGNGREVRIWGTGTNDWDSDDDELGDGYEVDAGIDPLDADTDDDGIEDGAEVAGRTDPNNDDTNPPVIVLSSPAHGQKWVVLP